LRLWAIVILVLLGAGVSKSCQRDIIGRAAQHCRPRRSQQHAIPRVAARLPRLFFNGGKTNTRQVRSILPPAEMSSEVHCFLVCCFSDALFLSSTF
jgi:hypothetical protein